MEYKFYYKKINMIFMKDIFKMIKRMDKDKLSIKMVMYTTDNSFMIKYKAKAK